MRLPLSALCSSLQLLPPPLQRLIDLPPRCLPRRSAEAELTRRQIVGLDVRSGGPLSLTQQGPPQVRLGAWLGAREAAAQSRGCTHPICARAPDVS